MSRCQAKCYSRSTRCPRIKLDRETAEPRRPLVSTKSLAWWDFINIAPSISSTILSRIQSHGFESGLKKSLHLETLKQGSCLKETRLASAYLLNESVKEIMISPFCPRRLPCPGGVGGADGSAETQCSQPDPLTHSFIIPALPTSADYSRRPHSKGPILSHLLQGCIITVMIIRGKRALHGDLHGLLRQELCESGRAFALWTTIHAAPST